MGRHPVIARSRRVALVPVLVGLAVSCLLPLAARSQCPGAIGIDPLSVYRYSTPSLHTDPDTLLSFIGTGCATMKFGPNPPDNCGYSGATGFAILTASWMNSAFNVTSNGCTFTCQFGTCRLRGNDALPVELMDFDVEGGQAEGD